MRTAKGSIEFGHTSKEKITKMNIEFTNKVIKRERRTTTWGIKIQTSINNPLKNIPSSRAHQPTE